MTNKFFNRLDQLLFESDSNLTISNDGRLLGVIEGDEYHPLATISRDSVVIDSSRIPSILDRHLAHLKYFLDVNRLAYTEVNPH